MVVHLAKALSVRDLLEQVKARRYSYSFKAMVAAIPTAKSALQYTGISDTASAKPILLIYTDDGPDHNYTLASNQLALICLFLQLDLDILQAVRTAKHHSWKTTSEQVNCILHLRLQAIQLMHQEMTPELEAVVMQQHTRHETSCETPHG